MSVGVNVMFKVLEYVSGILGDEFDVEIVEAHHNLKKDAPSGTAMRMAQIIAEALGRNLDKAAIYERKGMIGRGPGRKSASRLFEPGTSSGSTT